MRILYGLAAFAVTYLVANGFPATASRDLMDERLNAVRLEVLVFESESCIYCRIFRRDVLPQYLQSKRAKMAPIKFIDVKRVDPKKLGIVAPLTMLPTFVIMREGRERGRINGYLGPEPFFHMVSQILRTAQ